MPQGSSAVRPTNGLYLFSPLYVPRKICSIYSLVLFSDEFVKLRKATVSSSCVSVCPRGTSTICLLTSLLTPWSRVLLEKPTGSAASQEIPRIFGTRISSPYSQVPATPPYPEPTPSSPPQLLPTSWRSITTLSSHLRLGLTSGLFPLGFLTRTLCSPLPYSICATWPAHLNFHYKIF